MRLFVSYLIGLVFGVGIAVSGMANPAKVLNFFDIAGTWDPSLIFVMGGALVTTFASYRLVFGSTAPIMADRFQIPTGRSIDARLLSGSAVFGIGWGIAGFCPVGALPALGTGRGEVLAFTAALMAGILLAKILQSMAVRAERASIRTVREQGLTLEWIIETHVHADHLSAAPYIQDKLGGKIGVGSKIMVVQETFGKIFNEGTEFQRDGSQFDRLFEDGDTYTVGNMPCFAIYTPGHTPACMVHVMGDAAFVGDTLFMPDGGSARADFPGDDAGTLYDSIQKVLALPEEMRLYMCHDYGPNGRDIEWETTVGEEKAHNIHVGNGKTREDFIRFRTERDATLDMPKLIIPSLQVNMRAGEVPTDKDGRAMLKVPVNTL